MSREAIKKVETLKELLSIKTKDLISITNDIDCEGQSIPLITEMFRGTIDGNNHTISNLILSTEVWGDEQSIALFHYLSHASITNLHFKRIRLEIDKEGYSPRIAGLCYSVGASTIDNVSMELLSPLSESIPLIYEANSAKITNAIMLCNGKPSDTIKYE